MRAGNIKTLLSNFRGWNNALPASISIYGSLVKIVHAKYLPHLHMIDAESTPPHDLEKQNYQTTPTITLVFEKDGVNYPFHHNDHIYISHRNPSILMHSPNYSKHNDAYSFPLLQFQTFSSPNKFQLSHQLQNHWYSRTQL